MVFFMVLLREFCVADKVSRCETRRNVANPIRYAKRDRVPHKEQKTIARMVFFMVLLRELESRTL